MIGLKAPRLLKFFYVGGSATLLYLVLSLALSYVMGFSTTAASVVAYVLAAVFSYLAHRNYTFQSANDPRREVTRFIAANLTGLALATVIPLMLVDYPAYVSFLAVFVIVPCVSYLLLKLFVFQQR